MTVNVTEEVNTITVNGKSTLVNAPDNRNKVTVNGSTKVVTVIRKGEQGASFSGTNKNMIDTDVVDGSVPYYHAASGTYRADQTTTKLSLVDGGNF